MGPLIGGGEGALNQGEQTPQRASGDADLAAGIEQLPRLVNEDSRLVHRGRFLRTDLLLELGALSYYLSIDAGRITTLVRGPLLMRPWRFAIRGHAEGWRKFWQPVPPPGFHDLFALTKGAGFRIEGDLHPLIANLLYFKDVLAAPRRLAQDGRP
jgi:hypothetical protein